MVKMIVWGALVVIAAGCSAEGSAVEPKPDPSTTTTASQGGAGGAGGSSSSSGGEGPAPAGISGERLKVRRIVSADGAELVSGLRDSSFGFDCVFGRATDGEQRCLPQPRTVYFLDNGCTVPALYWASCDAAPGYISRSIPDQCGGSQFEVRQVQSATNQAMAFFGDATNCIEVAKPSGVTLFELSAPMPPAQFVAVSTETES